MIISSKSMIQILINESNPQKVKKIIKNNILIKYLIITKIIIIVLLI